MINTGLRDKFEKIGTPFYYYDLALLRSTLDVVMRESSSLNGHIHYAIKANANDRILKVIQEAGLGADCVSGNEVLKAIQAGFPKNKIVFAGVGKNDKEIEVGLHAGIFGFNSESVQELQVINQLAANNNLKGNVCLRINPNVDAKTHRNITTGLEENKFGINLWEIDEVVDLIRSSKNLNLIGLHFHIGSQVTDLSRYKELCLRVNEVNNSFSDKGLELTHINLGGGLGINYEDPVHNTVPDFKAYFGVFRRHLALRPDQVIHFELGRAIVGQCGILISRVLYEKAGKSRRFLILDAGMTELMRPALYQAYHHIENISSDSEEKLPYDVVGPICETTDAFARELLLPISRRGDLMAIYSAGAYGEVLKNQYNLRDIAKAVYSDDLPG